MLSENMVPKIENDRSYIMTDHDFDSKLKEIDEQYKSRRESADAYRDQEIAKLFEICGWKQERIAERMGKKQVWVSQRLTFGRFLVFIAAAIKPESLNGLTEFRFRGYWSKTKGTEDERFAQVADVITGGIPHGIAACHNKPGVKQAIVDAMRDGKWYTSSQILATVEETLKGVTTDQISNALRAIKLSPMEGRVLESNRIGKKAQYRVVKEKRGAKGGPQTESEVLYEKVSPLIDELESLSRRSKFDLAPEMFRSIAVRLRRIFEESLDGAT